MIFNAPINNLSFGNVSYNILREYYRNNKDIAIFPISDKVDVSVFDKIDKGMVNWLQNSLNKRYEGFDKRKCSLKIWHINGSESRLARSQALYTFHELDQLTPTEINLLKAQDAIFVSNRYTRDIFESYGLSNVVYAPLGFDEDFKKTGKDYKTEEFVHFGLMGKFEKRKHTAEILRIWAEKFGNNHNYRLTCCINNSFMKKQHLEALISQALGGKRYFNISFLPYLNTNSLMNDFINSIDIDLTGLSGAEGWNLPAFNATCLGKWSVVLNATAHKDWANEENSILVEPNGKIPAYDNLFFKQGLPFNQGNIYSFDEASVKNALDIAVSKAKSVNTNGELLKEEFKYENTYNIIENIIG